MLPLCCKISASWPFVTRSQSLGQAKGNVRDGRNLVCWKLLCQSSGTCIRWFLLLEFSHSLRHVALVWRRQIVKTNCEVLLQIFPIATTSHNCLHLCLQAYNISAGAMNSWGTYFWVSADSVSSVVQVAVTGHALLFWKEATCSKAAFDLNGGPIDVGICRELYSQLVFFWFELTDWNASFPVLTCSACGQSHSEKLAPLDLWIQQCHQKSEKLYKAFGPEQRMYDILKDPQNIGGYDHPRSRLFQFIDDPKRRWRAGPMTPLWIRFFFAKPDVARLTFWSVQRACPRPPTMRESCGITAKCSWLKINSHSAWTSPNQMVNILLTMVNIWLFYG